MGKNSSVSLFLSLESYRSVCARAAAIKRDLWTRRRVSLSGCEVVGRGYFFSPNELGFDLRSLFVMEREKRPSLLERADAVEGEEVLR